METRQKILALVFGLALLLAIIELVRRRRLKEEYAWLWILAGAAILVLGLSHTALMAVTRFIGAGFPASTLFFFGIFFVLALSLQFSVKVSRLEDHVKNLAQELALLKARKPNASHETGSSPQEPSK